MPGRGPYNQYKVDASIAVPRSTLHDRRKRRLVEVIISELVESPDENNVHPLPLDDEQVYLDDHLQVRP